MNLRYLLLIKIQIKSAFKYLPRILLGMAVFGIITLFIMTAAVYVSSKDTDNEKMRVAIVIDENAGVREQQYVKMAFGYIQDMDSVNNVCIFSDEYTFDEAEKLLDDGSLTALIRIPAGFIDGILYGRNIPAIVYFNGKSCNITDTLLRYMMQAGAADLSTAQAGIYAFSDTYIAMSGVDELLKKQETLLNKAYFSYALDRQTYFKTENIDKDYGMSTKQSYVYSAIIIFLMFTTISCAGFFNKDKKIVIIQMKRTGMLKESVYFSKVIGLSVVLSIIIIPVYILTMLSTIRYFNLRDIIMLKNADDSGEYIVWTLLCICALVFLIFCIYMSAGAVLSCFSQITTGILVLFMVIILTVFAGGLIIPVSMLPDYIKDISVYMPAYWYYRLAAQIMTGTLNTLTVCANIFYAAISALVITIAERIK